MRGEVVRLLRGWMPGVAAQPSLKTEGVSDKELQAFVRAYLDIQALRLKYEPALRNAAGDEAKKIEREADSEIENVLEKHGLEVETYKRIFKALAGDEELRKKTLELIEATGSKLRRWPVSWRVGFSLLAFVVVRDPLPTRKTSGLYPPRRRHAFNSGGGTWLIDLVLRHRLTASGSVTFAHSIRRSSVDRLV